jgi:HK97 family phage prohead protease
MSDSRSAAPAISSLAQFKGALRKGLVPPTTVIHKWARLTSAAAGERRKLFTISTEAIDRDGDTVSLNGWDLKNYKKNPIVLWEHRAFHPPIGRTVEIAISDNALQAVVEFVPANMPIIGEHAEMVFRMCDEGFLSACSVGFTPIDFTIATDRMTEDDWYPPIDFSKQELMEWSICTIPANPEAIIRPDDDQQRSFVAPPEPAQPEPEEVAELDPEVRAQLDARRRQLRAACY